MQLEPGQRLLHYRLAEKIGEGGMGVVWKAADTTLGRDVAIKILPPVLAGDAERLERFAREARLLASLNHPGVAAIYGLHEDGDVHFLAMELVEGEDLAQRLQRGPLPVTQALEMARQVAAALEVAHERGIIHRDLKPANIKLASAGGSDISAPEAGVKLLDFGLGKLLEPEAGESDLTRSPTLTAGATREGVILGTAAYMSPEQAHGRPADRRSDIWSFGCTLFEALSGQKPFVGESISDTLAAVLRSEPAWEALPAATPAAVRRLLGRCLRKDPRQRLQAMGDARVILEEALAAPEDEAAFVPAGQRTPVGRLAPWIAAGAVVLVLAGFVAGRQVVSLSSGSGAGAAAAGSPAFTRFTQLTFQSGVESSPSLSPDGAFVAYVAADGGDLDIHLLRAGGQRAINLTEDSDRDDDHPAFSPDGRFIAFDSERGGGGLFIMGATGESVRRLTDFGHNPSWSPDGRQIVFATEGESDPSSRSITSELWVVDAAGGEPRKLYDGDAVQPAWSPNGERIAFWEASTGVRNVLTIRADGTDLRPVTTGAAVDWSPAWDPSGEHLYFASDRGGVMNLWRVALDPDSGEVLGEPTAVTVPTRWGGQMSLSADAGRLVYRTVEFRSRLTAWPFDARAGRLTGPARTILESTLTGVDPDLSSQGWVVFRTAFMQEDLYLMRADGTGLRRLTDDAAKDRGPRWSPDGSRLAFYSNRSGDYEIWTIGRDGGDLRQQTRLAGKLGSLLFPVWGTGGDFLLATTRQGVIRFPVRDEAVGEDAMERLDLEKAAGDAFLVPRSLSPDGRWLQVVAIDADGYARPALLVHDLKEGSSRSVPLSGEARSQDVTWPGVAWLDDGRRGILRWRHRAYLVEIDGPTVTPIAEGLDPGGGTVFLGPGGQDLYTMDLVTEGDLWLAHRD